MHRALPGGGLLLGLLILTTLSGGCVALYTLSEAADPPPGGPDGRVGLPLFPPGGSIPSPIPTPEPEPIATETLPPWASESGGAPYVPHPSEPLVTETPPPWTWAPTEPPAGSSPAPAGTNASQSVEPTAREPLFTPTPYPTTPTGELPVDDGMPGRDEIYHPIVTAMPPL